MSNSLTGGSHIFISLSQTTRLLKLRRNVVKLSLYQHFTKTLIFSVLGKLDFCVQLYTVWDIQYCSLLCFISISISILSILFSLYNIPCMDNQTIQVCGLSVSEYLSLHLLMIVILWEKVLWLSVWVWYAFLVCQGWRDLWVDDAFWRLLFSTILLVIMVLLRPSVNSQRLEEWIEYDRYRKCCIREGFHIIKASKVADQSQFRVGCQCSK